ncbi:MAG: tRNA 2-selenouridine(34) synthase MnmH [Sphingobacteriales bacterium]|nr:tRNA 2-selenouridine(34) synthase MnmH [Sphingobacteriales bacterium]MBI3719008.1 tRNA 2-selenouridine(34) synthase MnmH [Sphingobacteriales bacterium]
MAVRRIDIDTFLSLFQTMPVFDVRSPGEYNHAHIPGAYSLPLFTDEERKVVGTTYKQQSREWAIKVGLDYFGTKMRKMVEEVEAIVAGFKLQAASTTTPPSGGRGVIVHCWRGGMRSAGVAWLLDLYGFEVYTLVGGYKVFRRHVLNTFNQSFHFRILGGYTGSGKTYVLNALEKSGEAVIDLEGLAHHKGSAFGAIGMPVQPSQEMFENLLAVELNKKRNNTIWLEDESQRLGLVNIPQPMWLIMRHSTVFFLDIPFEERLKHIIAEYGKLDKERMVNAIIRIKKRLGGLETKTAINYLIEDDIEKSFEVLLKYYDKQYSKGLHNRENLESFLNKIPGATVDATKNAQRLIASLQMEKFA